ncbi:MAG: MFS transporter, partial [Ketobacteraceae bacterium]|nr:MFS transporter [Ketobacteraceae bacterium]
MLLTRPVLTMLFLGFSAGIPLLLIFSSLSLWLREAGVDRSTVTYFSWAALAYSFKFLWAPLVDRMPLPLLTNWLGRRRAWLLVSQLSIAASIGLIAMVDPSDPGALNWMAAAVIMLGFSAATQDIVIDAFRIESASQEFQALLSSTYIAGYRIGMLTSGAGALVLASYFGTTADVYDYSAWRMTYLCMALTMLVGLTTTLVVGEPVRSKPLEHHYRSSQYARFLSIFFMSIGAFVGFYVFAGDAASIIKQWLQLWQTENSLENVLGPVTNFLVESWRLLSAFCVAAWLVRLSSFTPLYERNLVQETYIDPVLDFFRRYGVELAVLLLLFVGFYRISDIVLGVISNVFFQDMGFTKNEIATVVKTFGLFMTILGGFLGGFLALRFGVMRTLYLGAFLTVATNLLFMWLA